MRYCSPIRLEFHENVALGTTVGSPLVLIDIGEELADNVPLPVALQQLVQGVDFVGDSSPANWVRGNKRTQMDFSVWRSSSSAAQAIEDSLTDSLTLPTTDGWIRVTLESPVIATWAIADVAIQSINAVPDEAIGRVITYTLQTGELIRTADIPVPAVADYSRLLETGDYLLLEDGVSHKLLEEAP